LVDVILLTLTGVLLAITAGAAVQYYRLIRRAQFEYEKARELVEDVVMSFDRELRRETDKLDITAYKIEANASKTDNATKRIDAVENRLAPIDNQLVTISEGSQRVAVALTETNSRLQVIETSQENLKAKVADLQEQVQKLSLAPELKVEPVIPIKRDKAMAALTNTEVAVLEMLVAEGAKTAPEIKERVQLSREHTARLMKKLYEEGYLERETGKIPFKYKVKKEMERLLGKPETASA
jgi:chromosome segregation ATPase